MYIEFIQKVQTTQLPQYKNTSSTKLIYKEIGDMCMLINYRPIALMNVDVKILTKVLANRLKMVLPSIIHHTQTAVFGRKIHNTVNLVRDLIDLANAHDEGAAFLFLDQEKAFDRVNHNFLYNAMREFGIGEIFISWIKTIYSNAETRLNINGHLTEPIPLKRGVRQGCPLSSALYVIIIEILSLQLRTNPNIIGFQIGGEKIISSHYLDDAVIKIKQNECFKEVYKELKEYENATGAKINYNKTKGLWVGKWRHRTDDPFETLYSDNDQKIKWTNKNVKYLGVYVGNEQPSTHTFEEIMPHIRRKFNYCKPLNLPILSRAKVIEIFLASPLWYACSFYPIPQKIEKELDELILDFIIFPKKKQEISRTEMEKLDLYGGIKLMKTKLKSQTSKIKWLIDLITDKNLQTHLNVFKKIIGKQKFQMEEEDVIYADKIFLEKHLKLQSPFYLEALEGIAKLKLKKPIKDLNKEPIFYNRIFTTNDEDTGEEKSIKPFKSKHMQHITTYGDLISSNPQSDIYIEALIQQKLRNINNIWEADSNQIILSPNDEPINFRDVTQKLVYSELVHKQSRDHVYQLKWITDAEMCHVNWEKVWESIHNQFFTNKIKSTIWEQIHLNFYTTYNYNKWHKNMQPCPLCNKIPEEIFHIILECKFVLELWKKLEPTLLKIIPRQITPHELAFGIQPPRKKDENATILRNYLTFTMRNSIMEEERKAYYKPSNTNIKKFMLAYNNRITEEIATMTDLFHHLGKTESYEKIITTQGAVATKNPNGTYKTKIIMK